MRKWKREIKIACAFVLVCILFLARFVKLGDTNLVIVPSPTPKGVESRLKIKASIPYWEQEKAYQSFRNNIDKFDYVNLFWYYLGSDNTIEKYEYANEDTNIIRFAKTNNVKVIATITNLPEKGGWDSERVEEMLKTPTSRKKHIHDIATKLRELKFDGINIDYEEVDPSERNHFSAFIRELSVSLHKENKLLTISLHPKTHQSEGLGRFQDWKTLTKNADQLTIMAFNEHWDDSQAGPIASITWVNEIIAYARLKNIPKEKIYLGIPLFGYDWNRNNELPADGLTFTDVQQLLIAYKAERKWHEVLKSPYFFYRDGKDTHEVWYEDKDSIQEKIALAEKSGLAGISFWRLGDEDERLWSIIKQH